MAAIEVTGLRKAYGTQVVLDGIDLLAAVVWLCWAQFAAATLLEAWAAARHVSLPTHVPFIFGGGRRMEIGPGDVNRIRAKKLKIDTFEQPVPILLQPARQHDKTHRALRRRGLLVTPADDAAPAAAAADVHR